MRFAFKISFYYTLGNVLGKLVMSLLQKSSERPLHCGNGAGHDQ